MNSCQSRGEDVTHLSHVANSDVLHKLLKRARTYEDVTVPFPGATIISKLLKRNMSKREVSGGQQEATESEAPQENTCSSPSQDSPQECLSPFGSTSLCQFHSERLNDEHLWAKRARVENIIRGMSHSPNVMTASFPSGKDHEQDGEGETEAPLQSSSPRDGYRESKRKQKLPQQQQQQQSFQQLVSAHEEQRVKECRQLKLQLEDMQKQLRQLQEKFLQMYESTDSEANGGNISEGSTPSDEGLTRALLCKKVLALDKAKCSLRGKDFISMHEEGKHLAETLKQELNSAMSQVVETVVKVFSKPLQPLLEVFPSLPLTQNCFAGNADNPNLHTADQRLRSVDDVIIPSPLDSIGGVPPPNGNNQTEALSLVVQKSTSGHHRSSALRAHGGHTHPSLHTSHPYLHTSSLSANVDFSPQSFRHPFSLPLIGYSFHSALANPSTEYSSTDQRSPDSMDQESTSVQTTMLSVQHLGRHRSRAAAHSGSPAEGLSTSLIKSEFGDGVSEILYPGNAMQDGLSPNHLKKAKLMFFYTRYPSSNMLKMFFSDVKFNRCVTAQLIKWFSNFREFFYSQMEKFARQAVSDGTRTADDITVTADSELYRVLNGHYNKSNEFQVPERFLEVAQITLREFFNAVVSGKDVDPSWKKAIYKVICKLDSDVPEIFKSKACLWKLSA